METYGDEAYTKPSEEQGMTLSQEAQYYLQQAAKWASFLAIMGFIGAGLIAVMGIFAGTMMAAMSAMPGAMSNPVIALMGPFIGAAYFVVAIVIFFINLALYQFASRAKKAIGFADSAILTSSIAKLKSFFKLKGIILIVAIILYIIFIVAMMIFAMNAASLMR
ncbi:DUF5362 family protein [Mucilaginibacter myungsuensis]|uniref:Uncharacterized protein n=1 Tax=Mucilaginibacter myungsuensis TaxID=649104 RepID=A0A929KU91_9SPHI|nr:DUF5362 family protein [Mucilaginibacter myungsuensis]MBE9660508.1 hypothetical protein [Mucilaginibacter myungsuensis]MDN3600552.1 DUF5362 family protein [Mucilaginibacter myungsuensis]